MIEMENQRLLEELQGAQSEFDEGRRTGCAISMRAVVLEAAKATSVKDTALFAEYARRVDLAQMVLTEQDGVASIGEIFFFFCKFSFLTRCISYRGIPEGGV